MKLSRALISLLAAGVVSFSAACNRQPDSPTGPTPNSDQVVFVALGASDAVGVGGSVICAVDCANGSSYVYVLKRRLQAAGKHVALTNIGVPAAVLSPTLEALSRQIGSDARTNFLENQVPFVGSTTTHVTVFSGGNDANTIARAVRAGIPGSDTPNDIRAYVDRQVQQWGEDFAELIRRIRSRAPNARIVAYNLPNLAAFPYVSRNNSFERSVLQRIAVGITDRINATASANVLVVDLMCESRVYESGNVADDGFHPNDRGYQLMADLGYPALAAGTAGSPAPSCSQRTIFPGF